MELTERCLARARLLLFIFKQINAVPDVPWHFLIILGFSCISSMMNFTKWFVKVFVYGAPASVWGGTACRVYLFIYLFLIFTSPRLCLQSRHAIISYFSQWFHYFFHRKCALFKCPVNIVLLGNKVQILNINLGLNRGLWWKGAWQNNLFTHGIYDYISNKVFINQL